MHFKEVISKFNPPNGSIPAVSPVGYAYLDNTDANNTNTTGLIAVKQFAGGNTASIVVVEGSFDNTRWVPIITLTQSAQTGGIAGGGTGAALLNIYAGSILPLLRMKVTTAAHTTDSANQSGVSLFVAV